MVRVMVGLGNGTNEARSVQSHENGARSNRECRNVTYRVEFSILIGQMVLINFL